MRVPLNWTRHAACEDVSKAFEKNVDSQRRKKTKYIRHMFKIFFFKMIIEIKEDLAKNKFMDFNKYLSLD